MWREEEERERRKIEREREGPSGQEEREKDMTTGRRYHQSLFLSAFHSLFFLSLSLSLSLCFPFTFLSSIYFLPEHLFILLSLPLRKGHTLSHTQLEGEKFMGRERREKKEGERKRKEGERKRKEGERKEEREESNHTHRAYDDMNVV